MLQTLITEQVLFYLAGGILVIALIAQGISAVSIKRLVSAAEDMGKSSHPLMKLVRSKYEHACMVNDKVQNVRALVDKYVYEYRVWGLRLYSWRRMKMVCMWLFGIVCFLGAFGAYAFGMFRLEISKYIVFGSGGLLLMVVLHLLTDEEYRLKAAKIYMIDFLGNTYAHRFEKTASKESRELREKQRIKGGEKAAEEPAVAVAAKASSPETVKEVASTPQVQAVPEEKETDKGSGHNKEGLDAAKEARIREILEEFLV